MLLCDCAAYRLLLNRLTFKELTTLYERTQPEYDKLAQIIAEELRMRALTKKISQEHFACEERC